MRFCRFRTVQLARSAILRWGRGDVGDSVKQIDELVDDPVYGQREMAIQPCHADLLCSPEGSGRFYGGSPALGASCGVNAISGATYWLSGASRSVSFQGGPRRMSVAWFTIRTSVG